MEKFILAVMYTVGYFGVVYFMLSGELTVPEGTKEAILVLLGVLTTGMPLIIRDYFGASREEREMLYKSTPPQHGPKPTEHPNGKT